MSATTAVDAEAADFGYLFEVHHKELFRLALLLTGGDRFLAEEAVGHASLAARRRRRRLERREAARRNKQEPSTNKGESAVDDRDVLWSALRLLPPKQRSAVVLLHYLDLSELETARVLQVSVGTVKSQTARGLVELRRELGELHV